MTRDDHVETGGVATTHLEPVQRGERDLDRVVTRERAATQWPASGQILDRASSCEPVPLQRPDGVLARDERRVASLDVVGVLVQVAGGVVELGLDRHESLTELGGAVLEGARGDGIGDEHAGPERTPQRPGNRLHSRGCVSQQGRVSVRFGLGEPGER